MADIVITTKEGWLSSWMALKGKRVRVEWDEGEKGIRAHGQAEGIVSDAWASEEDRKIAASPFADEKRMVSDCVPLGLDSGEIRQLPVKSIRKVWRLD